MGRGMTPTLTSNCVEGDTTPTTSKCVEGGMTKENEDRSLNFKWLHKKGIGGKKKEIQFYESFIYDDVEYTLYDCVYMHKEGYPEPYIGKLVKIWEHGGKTKKVKVQWFFYVWEILNYLGDKKALDKEIFLASGEGSGLANVNPLEAIAGKCNVVCISKDCRNAQPSGKELEAADYIFYRTFDVGRCTILDEMDDKVGGLEIKYIFNRKECENASSVPNHKSLTKEDTKTTRGSDDTLQLSSKNTPTKYNTLKIDGNCKQSVAYVNTEKEAARDVNGLLVKKGATAGVDPASEVGVATSEGAVMDVDIAITSRCEPLKTLHLTSDNLPDKLKTSKADRNNNQSAVKMNMKRKVIAGDVNDLLVRRESLAGVELASGAGEGTSAVAATSAEVGKAIQLKVDSNNDKAKVSKVSTNQVEVKQRAKSAPDSDSLLVRRESLAGAEPASGDGEGTSAAAATSVGVGKSTQLKVDSNNDKTKVSKVSTNQVEVKPRAKSARDSDSLEDRSGKKAKGVNSVMPKDEKLIAKEVNDSLVGRESLAGVENPFGAGEGTSDVAAVGVDIGKTTQVRADSNNDKAKVSKIPTTQMEMKPRAKSARDSDSLEERSGKKAKGVNSMKLPKDEKLNFEDKLPVQRNGAKGLVTTFVKEENTISGHVKDSPRIRQGEKSAKNSVDPEGGPSKKAKIDSSLELSEGKNRNNIQNLSPNCDGNNVKDTKAANISSKERDKSRHAPDFLGMKKEPKEQLDEKARKVYNGKLPVADEENKGAHQKFEVTRRPDVEKSSWFRQLPWEERLQRAYEQGTLLLLLNLDPEYTSGEIDDIIWHVFKETCTAKMVQRTAISSPSSGQALVIFKTREATEKVLRKLDADCLMLSNGRVVVGCTIPPLNLSGKQSTFFGHIGIDKIKLQMQREMKEAVSTSHCSQPNTIEYEMAMDWCALQTRSEKWWMKLYKKQQDEMKKLENSLNKK